MCNIYYHKCEICNEKIPMHIGDYKYEPEEVQAYCYSHYNAAPKGSYLFVLKYTEDDADYETGASLSYPGGWKCAIYSEGCPDIVHPNFAQDMEITKI